MPYSECHWGFGGRLLAAATLDPHSSSSLLVSFLSMMTSRKHSLQATRIGCSWLYGSITQNYSCSRGQDRLFERAFAATATDTLCNMDFHAVQLRGCALVFVLCLCRMNGFLQLLLSLHLQIPGPTREQWQMQADQTAQPLFWGCSRSLCNSGRKQECKQDQHEAGQASLRQWPETAQLTHHSCEDIASAIVHCRDHLGV